MNRTHEAPAIDYLKTTNVIMKKIFQYFAVFSVIVLTMTSCSSDDNSGTSPVLLKKMTNVSFGTHAVYTFSYKGTKLTKMAFTFDNQTNGDGYDKYYYTGDLITEIKRYNKSNHNTFKTVFSYNASNQLTQVVKLELDNNYGYKVVYQYNGDGSVQATSYYGDLQVQNTDTGITEKYYFQNGDIIAKEYSSSTSVYRNEYAYDTANHPLRNVTGIKAINIYNFMAEGLFGIEHNVKQRDNYDAAGTLQNSVSFEADYNQDNYPKFIYGVDTPEELAFTFQYNQ